MGIRKGQALAPTAPVPYQAYTPEELLGPLNDLEQQHAPAQLFAAGDPSMLKRHARVAIVGSRQASEPGCKRAGKLARLLCERGIVVVSGLAAGIDTAAHQAAIACGGQTIAVLGTPLDQVYPKANAQLQEQIMRDHLCLSQFPMGTRIERQNFPRRNLTMALIADATVIIEASDSSGSLKQAREALRLGRGLYLAKSAAEDASLSWPERLYNQGARILSDETLEELLAFLPSRTESEPHASIPF